MILRGTSFSPVWLDLESSCTKYECTNINSFTPKMILLWSAMFSRFHLRKRNQPVHAIPTYNFVKSIRFKFFFFISQTHQKACDHLNGHCWSNIAENLGKQFLIKSFAFLGFCSFYQSKKAAVLASKISEKLASSAHHIIRLIFTNRNPFEKNK